jgi:hypothetical protein
MKNFLTKPVLIKFTGLLTICFTVMLFSTNCTKKSSDNGTPTISGLKTNGALIPVSDTKLQGSFFVVDNQGKPITGITSSNIIATLKWASLKGSPLDSNSVNGLIVIQPAKNTKTGIATPLTMDYSGSMYTDTAAIPNMEKGVKAFVSYMKSTDYGEIIKFDDNVHVVCGMTNNTTKLDKAVDSVLSLGGMTALYQSIYQGLQDLVPVDTSKLKSVVAFTDGGENSSTVTYDQMISLAQSHGYPINTIGFGAGVDSILLKQIAGQTGGFFFYPKTSQQLAQIYQLISGVLSNAYSIVITWPTGQTPPSGTSVVAIIQTTYLGFTSVFSVSYIQP